MIFADIITLSIGLPANNHIQLRFCLGLSINPEINVVLIQILRPPSINLIITFLALSTNSRAHTWDSPALTFCVETIPRAGLNYMGLSLLGFQSLLLGLRIVKVWVERAIIDQHFVVLVVLFPTMIFSLLL